MGNWEVEELEAGRGMDVSVGDLADRRNHRRVESEAPVAPGTPAVQVTILNVSLGGICVTLDQPAERGDRYRLVLLDSRTPGTLELRAEVAWSKRGRTGMKWLDVTPDQFLWLCERLGFWWGPGHRFSVACARPEQVD